LYLDTKLAASPVHLSNRQARARSGIRPGPIEVLSLLIYYPTALEDARVKIGRWRELYHHERPYSRLGYLQEIKEIRIEAGARILTQTLAGPLVLMEKGFRKLNH